MTHFCVAHAETDGWANAAKACADTLVQSGGGAADGATVGFLFATDLLAGDMGSVLTYLRETTKVEAWIGTVGLGVCATGREYFDTPAVVAMTARLAAEDQFILPSITGADGIDDAAMAAWVADKQPVFGMVHGDPRNAETPDIVASLAERTGCFLIGGLSSSRGEMPQVAGGTVDGGVSGMLLSSEVPVVTGLSQGCTPIGPVRRVDQADGHVLMQIDGQPALDVFKEDIGPALADNLADVAGLIYVAVPVAGSDTGDYLVRNLIGLDEGNGLLAVTHEFAAGDGLMFCRRDAESAAEDLDRMLDSVCRRAGGPAKGAVYYSCVARGPNTFGPGECELDMIRRAIGDVPLAGFFGNGEISHNRLYGYTGVLALFL